MRRRLLVSSTVFLVTIALGRGVLASQLVDSKIDTKLLPAPVEFSVLLPDGYESINEPLPLLFFLHGGGGDRTFLTRMRPVIDDMWKAGTLPKMVIVTPSAGRSFTWIIRMDRRSGSRLLSARFSSI